MESVHGRGEVYLDNAATTPMHSRVIDVVAQTMRDVYGNPSSQHAAGRSAKELLEKSRTLVANMIGAFPDEIYFTSGGTEANNLAIAGVCEAHEREHGPGTIVTTALEHPSVTKTVRGFKRRGWSVVYLDAPGGELDFHALERSLEAGNGVQLVTTMTVQSELGYHFPVERIVGTCRQVSARAGVLPSAGGGPLVHTDAVQAFGKFACDVRASDVDLLSFCSHKIGGPKGIGALYVRRGIDLFTTAFGGGQERGLRSGTEALPLIAGFAEAARIAQVEQASSYARAVSLRDKLIGEMRGRFPDIMVNSREDGSPFIVNFTVPSTHNRRILERLSDSGIYLSASMACATNHTTVPPGTWREKHPLALQLAGIPAKFTRSTYRISFSDRTTDADIDRFLEEFGGGGLAQKARRTA